MCVYKYNNFIKIMLQINFDFRNIPAAKTTIQFAFATERNDRMKTLCL